MVNRQPPQRLLFGLPISLIWGFVAIAVFMTGDGIELAFLSRYVVDLGFSPTQATLLFTVYGLLAAISSWGSGVLAETFGPRRIMLIGVAAWIVFHVLFLIFGLEQQNYTLMVVFYGIRGLAYPLFIYAFMVWIAQVTPGARMASAMGWFWSMYCIGIGLLGNWIPSLSISRIGFINTLWVGVFWVAVAGLMIMYLVKERGAGKPDDAVTLVERLKTLSSGVTIIAERRGMFLIVLVRIICNLSLFGLPVILPLYLTSVEVGFSMEQWLHLWGVMFVVSIFTNVIWGQIGDRLGWLIQMRWFGCIGCALSSLAFYYLPQFYGAHFEIALIAAIGFGISVTAFVPMGAVFLALAPEQKGAAISAHNLAAGLSNFMGPGIATLFIATLGIKGVVWIYAGLYVAGAVLTFFIPVHQPRLSQQVSRYTSAAEPTQPL
ncbi:MAG: MFS transporter [Pseudomonas sp.]|uniref:MFS transporter n=1 Tax=Pseudomonas shahriarae TaxID=2745512 RepID=UPI00235F6984|nr:MFS transporter [Pseudomonas shahriarae]MDD1132037.1 MFS transporter [Pseudomonas shahriarae]